MMDKAIFWIIVFVLANVVGTLLIYTMGQLVNLGAAYYLVSLSLVALFFAICVLYGRNHQGHFTLGKAFLVFLAISVLGIGSGVSTKYLLFQVDSSLNMELRDKVIQHADLSAQGTEVTGMLPKTDSDRVREDMKRIAMQEGFGLTFEMALGTTLFYASFGAVASLLMAALLRSIPDDDPAEQTR